MNNFNGQLYILEIKTLKILEKDYLSFSVLKTLSKKDPFKYAITLVNDINSDIVFECNNASETNQSITWIKSIDKFHINILEQTDDNKTEISSNSLNLTIKDLSLSDQQYYGCYYSTNELEFISVFYLIVRSKILKYFVTCSLFFVFQFK